jgi:hypothetical protein
MTRLNHLAPPTTMARRYRARRAAHGPAREARTRRSFDGVVASYIRELSPARDTTPRPRARRELQGTPCAQRLLTQSDSQATAVRLASKGAATDLP